MLQRKSGLILFVCVAAVVVSDNLLRGWRGGAVALTDGGLFLLFACIGAAIGAGMLSSKEQATPGGLYRGANLGVLFVTGIHFVNELKDGGLVKLVRALWPR